MSNEYAIKFIEHTIIERGLKKQAVAQRMGITAQQFSDLLCGRRIFKFSDVGPICDALGITPNELYGYDGTHRNGVA